MFRYFIYSFLFLIVSFSLSINVKANGVLTDAQWRGSNLVLRFSDSILYQVDFANSDSKNVAVSLIGANLSAISNNLKVEPFTLDAPGGLTRATLVQLKPNLVTLKINLLPNYSFSVLWRPYSNQFLVYTYQWDKLSVSEKEFHKGLIALENGLKEQVEKLLATSASLGNKNARSVLGVFYAKVGNDEFAEQYLTNPSEPDDYAALAEVKTRSGDKALAFSYDNKFRSLMKAQRVTSNDDSITLITNSQKFLKQLDSEKKSKSAVLNSLNDPIFITIILIVILLFILIVFLITKRSGGKNNSNLNSKRDFFRSNNSRKNYYDYSNEYSNYSNKKSKSNITNDDILNTSDFKSVNNDSDSFPFDNAFSNSDFRIIPSTSSIDISDGEHIVNQAKALIKNDEIHDESNEKGELKSSDKNTSGENDSNINSKIITFKDNYHNDNSNSDSLIKKNNDDDEVNNLDLKTDEENTLEEKLEEEIITKYRLDNKFVDLQNKIPNYSSEISINTDLNIHKDNLTNELKSKENKENLITESSSNNKENQSKSTIKNDGFLDNLNQDKIELKIPTITNEFLKHNRFATNLNQKPKQLSVQTLELRKKIETMNNLNVNLTSKDNPNINNHNFSFTDSTLLDKNLYSNHTLLTISKRWSKPTAGFDAMPIKQAAKTEKVSRDYIMLKELMQRTKVN
jgi:hypothetical protein